MIVSWASHLLFSLSLPRALATDSIWYKLTFLRFLWRQSCAITTFKHRLVGIVYLTPTIMDRRSPRYCFVFAIESKRIHQAWVHLLNLHIDSKVLVSSVGCPIRHFSEPTLYLLIFKWSLNLQNKKTGLRQRFLIDIERNHEKVILPLKDGYICFVRYVLRCLCFINVLKRFAQKLWPLCIEAGLTYEIAGEWTSESTGHRTLLTYSLKRTISQIWQLLTACTLFEERRTSNIF